MRIYRSCPTQKNAKDAWRYFVNKNKEEPRAMWKMPNNFKADFSVESGAWGLWIADYAEWKDYYNPNTDTGMDKARNVFSFIKKQSMLDRVVATLKGKA